MSTPTDDHLPGVALTLSWAVSPSAPGSTSVHAQLLRAVTGEIYRQPFGTYQVAEIAQAAEDLITALQSQLPAVDDDDVPRMSIGATMSIGGVDVPVDVPRVSIDNFVAVANLLQLFRSGLFNNDRALPHLQAALGGAVGVAWAGPSLELAGWEQCLPHLLDDLRTGRIEGLHDPAASARMIMADEEPVACSNCAAEAEQLGRELCTDGQCRRCWGCRRAAAEAPVDVDALVAERSRAIAALAEMPTEAPRS
jgi:hypothetical protein